MKSHLFIEFECIAKFLKIIAAVNLTLFDSGLMFAICRFSTKFLDDRFMAIYAASFA